MAEKTVKQMQQDFSTMKSKATRSQKKVDALDTEYQNKTQEIATLETSIKTYQDQIQGIQLILQDEAAAISSLGSATVDAMKNNITTLTAKVGVLEGEKATKLTEQAAVLSKLEAERENLVNFRSEATDVISIFRQNPHANEYLAKIINYEYENEIQNAEAQKRYNEDLNTQINDSLHGDLADHLTRFNDAKKVYSDASRNALTDPSIDPTALRMEYLNRANELINEIQSKHKASVTLNDLANLQEVDGKYTIESINNQISAYDSQSKYLQEVKARALELLESQKSTGSVDVTDIENQITQKASEVGIKDSEIAAVIAEITAKEAEIAGAGVDNTDAIEKEKLNLQDIENNITAITDKIDDIQTNINILTQIEDLDTEIQALEDGTIAANLQEKVDNLQTRADGIPFDYFTMHPDAKDSFTKFRKTELALRQAMEKYSTDASDESKSAFADALKAYQDAGIELESKSKPYTVKEWHNFLNDKLITKYENGNMTPEELSIYAEDPEQKFTALEENYPAIMSNTTDLGKSYKSFHDEDIARRKINQKILSGEPITADDYFAKLEGYTNSSDTFINEFKKEYKEVDLEKDAHNTPLQKLFNTVKSLANVTKGLFGKIKNFFNRGKQQQLEQQNLENNLTNDTSVTSELQLAQQQLESAKKPETLANQKSVRDALRAKLTSSKTRANLEAERDSITNSVLAGLLTEKEASELAIVALGTPKNVTTLTAERDALVAKKTTLEGDRATLQNDMSRLEQQKANATTTTISDAQNLGVPGFSKGSSTIVKTAVEETKKQAQKDVDEGR